VRVRARLYRYFMKDSISGVNSLERPGPAARKGQQRPGQ
jgi:hypothetical protein